MSAPILSVVITAHEDSSECLATIASIRATAPEPEIVVVEDGGSQTIRERAASLGINFLRMPRRIGVGPARYVGVCAAKGEHVLLTDAHMRFTPGWYEAWKLRASGMTSAVSCAVCLGLDADNMDPAKPKGVYHGATWRFCGPDKDPQKRVFECVWADNPANGPWTEIPSIMGAAYFMHRSWFALLNPLRHLRSWGGDEQELSLKSWLAGGSVYLLPEVRIGHKFKAGKLGKILPWEVCLNKLFVLHTCLPPELAMRLQRRMPKDGHTSTALKRLHADWHLVETERAYNRQIFKRDFEWYLAKFNLTFPSD